uniref:Interleukin 6 cytokine family signal transducer n=1 Tax=Leptobrachium leishanense TaxID=445787 RepID=A0A8C5MJV6_9ANUR
MMIYYVVLAQVALLINTVFSQLIKPCGYIVPESPLLELNTSFTAYCILNESCMLPDPKTIFWKLQNKSVPDVQYTVLNSTVSSVTIHPTSPMDTLLTCNALIHGEIRSTLYGIFLRFGWPPDKPKNLTCISYNAERLTCSWDPGRATLLPTNYTLKRKWSGSDEELDCIPKHVNNSCTLLQPNFQLYINTQFWVEATNEMGTERSDILFEDIANLVKPNPPEIKSVISSKVLRRALKIEWSNPLDKDPNMKMKYIIRYRPNSSTEWEEVPQADTASHRTSFTLQELLSYTAYVVSIRCMQSNGQGFWSDWSKEKTAVSPEDKPTKGPSLWRAVGNADEFGNRSVQLLWKDLEPVFAKGKILNYTVTFWKKSEPFKVGQVTGTSYEVILPKDFFIATVVAHNSVESSPPSSLPIPSAKNSKAQTAEIEVKAFPKDGKLWVEWDPLNKTFDGYIIEWCIHSEITSCEIQWQLEPGTSRGAFLIGDIQPFICYLIKVFPVYKDGRESFNSTQAYLQQGAPSKGPNIRNKKVEKERAILEWDPVPLDDQNGFIKYYTITYYPHLGNESTLMINQSDTPNNEFTLTSLVGDTLYSVYMTAYTEAGQKDSQVYTFTTPKYATGEVEIIVVICSVIFLAISIVVTIICFAKRKLIKKHLWPNVPDPSKSNIAQWSPQTPSRHEFNPKTNLYQDSSFTDVSVVEVSEDKKAYSEPDIKAMDPLKKNTSEGLSSGIGGSSCMSSPQLSVSEGDEVESAQTTSSTVQYSTVIISGYRDQQPATVIPHVFSRSESTQPLLESEERPDDQAVLESEEHPVVANQYFRQNCGLEDVTGRPQTQEDIASCVQPLDGVTLANGHQRPSGSQVGHVIGETKSYVPQISNHGGYMPQ